jgi:hypothetical protein
MVIQEALAATENQQGPALELNEPVPPEAGTLAEVADKDTTHDGEFSSTVGPLTDAPFTVVERTSFLWEFAVLAATAKGTVTEVPEFVPDVAP